MTIVRTDESGNTWTFTFPAAVPGQTRWAIDSPRNRFIQGETFVARDYFPELYEITAEEQTNEND